MEEKIIIFIKFWYRVPTGYQIWKKKIISWHLVPPLWHPGCRPPTHITKMLDNIPPTKAALEQHLKRAVYQGVFVWGNFGKLQNLPSPEEWGWEKVDRGYSPVWSTLPDVWKSVQELISCTCKKGCKSRCKCVKEGLKCCALCDCEGDCVEDV